MKTVIGYLPRKNAPITERTKTTKTTVVTAAMIAISGPELPSVQKYQNTTYKSWYK